MHPTLKMILECMPMEKRFFFGQILTNINIDKAGLIKFEYNLLHLNNFTENDVIAIRQDIVKIEFIINNKFNDFKNLKQDAIKKLEQQKLLIASSKIEKSTKLKDILNKFNSKNQRTR